MPRNLKQRFLFKDANIRGEINHLDSAYRDAIAAGDYPARVQQLLGQLMSANLLLASTVKLEGSLILQVNGEAGIRILMSECRNGTDLRAIARLDETADSALELRGRLAITIQPDEGERYQGIVQIFDDHIVASIENYFHRSEQLETRIWLAANGEQAAGLLVQKLPGEGKPPASVDSSDDWNRICTLAETITDDELLELDPEQILTRLFHQETVQLFEPAEVRFNCGCSEQRSAAAIKFLGYDEAMELVRERGRIESECKFCRQVYEFGGDAVEKLFASEAAPEGTVIH